MTMTEEHRATRAPMLLGGGFGIHMNSGFRKRRGRSRPRPYTRTRASTFLSPRLGARNYLKKIGFASAK